MTPPYLISTATYNECGGWNVEYERLLYLTLDALDKRNIKFALSNVITHKGVVNEELAEWSKKYNVHYLEKSYSNCSYHLKDKESKTQEVLITNYKCGDI